VILAGFTVVVSQSYGHQSVFSSIALGSTHNVCAYIYLRAKILSLFLSLYFSARIFGGGPWNQGRGSFFLLFAEFFQNNLEHL
jgi:hypothetical protein